jgi:hypothetical protein
VDAWTVASLRRYLLPLLLPAVDDAIRTDHSGSHWLFFCPSPALVCILCTYCTKSGHFVPLCASLVLVYALQPLYYKALLAQTFFKITVVQSAKRFGVSETLML